MNYLPLTENALRQGIDATTVFTEYQRVRVEAEKFRAPMAWKTEGEYEYLVKYHPSPSRKQERLGKRSPELELVEANYTKRKTALDERLTTITSTMLEMERMNRAVRAGRVPNAVVSVLQVLDEAGLAAHFTVVGTHALYAYETAAGVRLIQGALATQDLDLLWDARKRMKFLTDIAKLDTSILNVLKRADSTFERKEGQNETAINARGFEVDFLRRQPVDADPHPFRFSDDEEDLWPVQAARAAVLTSAPTFEQAVISVSGRMASMRTIAPDTFVNFKRWMAEKEDRDARKRDRDRLQSVIVQELLDEQLLVSSTSL